LVGAGVGLAVGLLVGAGVGLAVGLLVGAGVGLAVGLSVEGTSWEVHIGTNNTMWKEATDMIRERK
jgi:hypothetical protein